MNERITSNDAKHDLLLNKFMVYAKRNLHHTLTLNYLLVLSPSINNFTLSSKSVYIMHLKLKR